MQQRQPLSFGDSVSTRDHRPFTYRTRFCLERVSRLIGFLSPIFLTFTFSSQSAAD